LTQSKSVRFSEPFRPRDYFLRWPEVSRSIFPRLSPQKTSRVKKNSLSSGGRFTLPMKKRCWHP